MAMVLHLQLTAGVVFRGGFRRKDKWLKKMWLGRCGLP